MDLFVAYLSQNTLVYFEFLRIIELSKLTVYKAAPRFCAIPAIESRVPSTCAPCTATAVYLDVLVNDPNHRQPDARDALSYCPRPLKIIRRFRGTTSGSSQSE